MNFLQVPIALLVLNDGLSKDHDDIVKEVKAKVRHDIGAIASLSGATVVEQLPKTRSGKVCVHSCEICIIHYHCLKIVHIRL